MPKVHECQVVSQAQGGRVQEGVKQTDSQRGQQPREKCRKQKSICTKRWNEHVFVHSRVCVCTAVCVFVCVCSDCLCVCTEQTAEKWHKMWQWQRQSQSQRLVILHDSTGKTRDFTKFFSLFLSLAAIAGNCFRSISENSHAEIMSHTQRTKVGNEFRFSVDRLKVQTKRNQTEQPFYFWASQVGEI